MVYRKMYVCVDSFSVSMLPSPYFFFFIEICLTHVKSRQMLLENASNENGTNLESSICCMVFFWKKILWLNSQIGIGNRSREACNGGTGFLMRF